MSHYREIADAELNDGHDERRYDRAISLAREAIAIAVTKGNRSGFMVDAQFEIETQARRLLLDALITLRPEYAGVLYGLRKSESGPSDYERQQGAYEEAEIAATRLANDYADRMYGREVG